MDKKSPWEGNPSHVASNIHNALHTEGLTVDMDCEMSDVQVRACNSPEYHASVSTVPVPTGPGTGATGRGRRYTASYGAVCNLDPPHSRTHAH